MKRFIFLLAALYTICFSAFSQATITDEKFSFAQVFDVQWYISGGTLYASGFNYLYASQPYNARLTSSETNAYIAAGDVIKFFNSTTNPGTYGLGIYDSTGTTLVRVLDNTGTFSALANGAIFYNGAGMWGTLFTTAQGYNLGGSGSWTITVQNPTQAQLQAYVPPTTQPLAAGQSAPPPAPTPVYNTIKMAYTWTNVSQTLVAGPQQQVAGSYKLQVNVQDGGGRSGTADSFQIILKFYNASGALVGTDTSQMYSLPVANPVTTLTLQDANCGGAGCANVSYVVVDFYGIDGSYWAGNYGPVISQPSLTFTPNGGTATGNLLYNPEFGIYQTTGYAQGWSSDQGWQACAAYSGYQTCVVNNSGTLNIVNGGYDATGGTAQGPVGGSVSSGNNSTSLNIGYSAAPTIVSQYNTTVQTTTTNGASVSTYNQPVTITNWSDGTQTQDNNGSATLINTTITGSGGGITTQQQNDINAFNANPINGSGIYIDQVGNNDIVTIVQKGSHSLIGGVNQQAAKIRDSNNTISIKQGNNNLGKNEIDMSVTGGSNNLYLVQASDPNGVSAGDNYQKVNVSGFSNNITTSQTNDGGLQGHFAEINVTGNYNTVNVSQSNNTQKQAFVSANGNNNTVQTTQTGTGAHYVSVTEVGNGNSAVVNQSGSTANTATITLTNAGAPASVNLTQTGGQSYSVQQTCYSSCGTITVRQGN